MSLFSSIGNSFGFGGGGSDRYDDALDLYNNIDQPTYDDLKIKLKEYVQQGILKPEQAEVILQDPSKFNDIATNPAYDTAELAALDHLTQVGSQGGLTATDRARMNDIQTDENQKERGAREALTQNSAERGMSNSGFDMLSKLINEQGSASRKSSRDMDVEANAEQRALDAMLKSGELASNLQNNDFNRQAEIAKANDAINNFNTTNKMKIGQYNTDVRNEAQKYNLGTKQDLANKNVDLTNKATTYNKSIPQQIFENAVNVAGKKSGILTGQGKLQDEHDKDVMGNWGNVAKGVAAFI